jgi:hypothetical protein
MHVYTYIQKYIQFLMNIKSNNIYAIEYDSMTTQTELKKLKVCRKQCQQLLNNSCLQPEQVVSPRRVVVEYITKEIIKA